MFSAMRIERGPGFALLAALAIAGSSPRAGGMPRYNDGCQDCHGAFTDDVSPGGTVFPVGGKHAMHRGQQWMATDCALCHSAGDGDNPFTSFSDGTSDTPGLGCLGCHGRDYGGAVGVTGAGLRAHHAAHDVLICGGCHFDDPSPLPESVAPPYYGSPDTEVSDPCNSGPAFQENWSLDVDNNDGLDNDGDDLYDGADPDCAPCPWDCGDGDGVVGTPDFLALLGQWGGPGTCDVDGDGTIGTLDFLGLLASWGVCP